MIKEAVINKLSIVIPNYNYENYISKTIESLINQSYSNLEIIIVDDGSTDTSFEIISNYKEKYPNKITAIKQQNMGQASAVNNGFNLVKGDVIGWINSDDTYCANSIEKVMAIFNCNHNIDIVYGDINMIDISGKHIYTLKHLKFSYTLSVFTGFANNISSNAIFWRKSVMDKVGLLNPEFKCGLDNEFLSRLTWKNNMYQLKIPIANFRLQEMSKAAIANSDWSAIRVREASYVFLYSYNNLFMSKIISFNFAKKIKPFILAYKRILKILTGRYFINVLEKYTYKKTQNNKIKASINK